MTVSIRIFQFKSDYENALTLWKNSGEGIGVGPSDLPDEITKKINRDPDLFLVAEDGDLLVGTVIGGFDGRRGMVYHLAVARNYRKKGLATQLLNEIEYRLHEKGCRKAYLMVRQGNDYVEKFYEKRGWQNMKEVKLFGKNL